MHRSLICCTRYDANAPEIVVVDSLPRLVENECCQRCHRCSPPLLISGREE
jgi:hypothetical protein